MGEGEQERGRCVDCVGVDTDSCNMEKGATQCMNTEVEFSTQDDKAVLAFIESEHERWEIRGSKVSCLRGKNTATYEWDGSTLTPSDDDVMRGFGTWEPETSQLCWFFPAESQEHPFYVFEQHADGFTNTQLAYKPLVHWHWEADAGAPKRQQYLVKNEGSGKGHPTDNGGEKWEVMGSVPFPVVLFAAMFARTQLLLAQLIERRSRGYTRCAAFTPLTRNTPFLCHTCQTESAQGAQTCVCCTSRSEGIKGRMCKTCGMRRNFCAKCNDILDNRKVEGFLCGTCGLGSDASGCAKMKY